MAYNILGICPGHNGSVALVSDGETTVDGAFHIDRGYPNFAEQLVSLGAKVSRD